MNTIWPLVSVVVPVYKVEQYLDECVSSIRSQSYHNLEIILVDDGSPDRCGEMCDSYALQDPRIRVIHKANGGLSDARNVGMEMAKGQYWCFVDSDDCLDIRTLQIMVDEAKRTGADVVIAQPRAFVDGEAIKPAVLSGEGEVIRKDEAMRRFATRDWGAWGKLYRREIHEGIQFPYGKIHEDEAIMFQLLSRCRTISVLADKLYYYRKRPGSITSVPYSVRKMDWLYAWAKNVEYVGKKDLELYLRCVSKLWTVMMYNLDRLVGQDCYRRELEDIAELASCYKKDILRNPYISRNAKLRLRVLLLSDIHKPGCLYARLYSSTDKKRRK
ncbi:MAG: glycosyltransferase family 2 protein [Oscillospiraceae bacterium]|nr:glycosyltransferase family 2 protein [Oscillospiraceae bacterium]